ncbi:MAG: peptidylprolyl isomerase [Coprobacillaceae bacterium]
MKKLAMFLTVLVMAIAITGCGAKEEDGEMIELPNSGDSTSKSDGTEESEKVNIVIDVENYGEITAELYSDVAPITVENFVKLVNEGFYDGLTFHRIIDGFMIQGGDPKGDGTGGSEETIKGEFSSNGVTNNITHARGVLSMARSTENDSASSQFFIMQSDSKSLDGDYAAFGRVTSGMEIVDSICKDIKVQDNNGTVNADDQPKINSIKIVE